MSEIIPFAFEDHLIRLVLRGGEPWFVLVDLCRSLAISNPTMAAGRLEEDEVAVVNINAEVVVDGWTGGSLNNSKGIPACSLNNNDPLGALGGNPNVNIVSESGMYTLVFTSRKPEARRFRKWVTAVVLPAIRKTGEYRRPGFEAAIAEAAAAPRQKLGDMSAAEMAARSSLVNSAARLYGIIGGRQLWDALGLPHVAPSSAVEDACETRAFETLEKILQASVNERPVLDWMLAAMNGDRLARETLDPIGVKFADRDDAVAIATNTPFMRRLFPDPGEPVRSLSYLAGARRSRLVFGHLQSRCVLLPSSQVEDALTGSRE